MTDLKNKPAPPPWVTNSSPSAIRRRSELPQKPKPSNVNRYVRRAPPKKISPNTFNKPSGHSSGRSPPRGQRTLVVYDNKTTNTNSPSWARSRTTPADIKSKIDTKSINFPPNKFSRSLTTFAKPKSRRYHSDLSTLTKTRSEPNSLENNQFPKKNKKKNMKNNNSRNKNKIKVSKWSDSETDSKKPEETPPPPDNPLFIDGIPIPPPPGPPRPKTPKKDGLSDAELDEAIEQCKIDNLLSNMNEGSDCLKNFHYALSVFSQQQLSQSESFLKLFKKSQKKYGEMQSMPNFRFAMDLIHNLLEETVRQQQSFAGFVHESCLPIIERLNETCREKHSHISGETKKCRKALRTRHIDVKNIQKKTQAAAEKAVQARQKSEIAPMYAAKSKNTKDNSNIFGGISKAFSSVTGSNTNSVEDSYTSAKVLEKKYKQQVSEYNRKRVAYIELINKKKKEIISTELFRINSMISVFQTMVQKQQRITSKDENKVTTLQQDVLMHTTTMDAQHIVQSFIREELETHGKWTPPEPKTATLNVEYRDMFHSISDAMSITTEINPNAKVPLIMTLLCEKIKDMNGFKTEGVFRKSPSRTLVKQMKKRIQVKNFTMNETNVHVYAVLLKQWLRDLEDLVIPMIYYDYCIDMAKKKKLTHEQFEVFFSQLPSVNRETIRYLIRFLRELIAPQNRPHTKMNLENIAIVFGPTLLKAKDELEPQVALVNSKYEKEFVASLIRDS